MVSTYPVWLSLSLLHKTTAEDFNSYIYNVGWDVPQKPAPVAPLIAVVLKIVLSTGLNSDPLKTFQICLCIVKTFENNVLLLLHLKTLIYFVLVYKKKKKKLCRCNVTM